LHSLAGAVRDRVHEFKDDRGDVSVEIIMKDVCEHCGYRWTEEGDYNGGCCATDEEEHEARLKEVKADAS